MESIASEPIAYVTVRVGPRSVPPACHAGESPLTRGAPDLPAARAPELFEGRYAAALRGLSRDATPGEGRVARAWGPLGPEEGLGVRAVKTVLDNGLRSPAEIAATAARLNLLLAIGEAAIVPVPEVVRVRVGIMGDALGDDVDAHRFAVAWTEGIAAAFGVDEVCLACTVNLRGSPAKEYCTSYWTADGVVHDRSDPGDETFLAITQTCWDAAMSAVCSL